MIGLELKDGERLSACILYAWVALAARRGAIECVENPHILYGMWVHKEGAPASYVVGLQASSEAPVPGGMVAVDVPAADYAVFRHKGQIGAIAETYGRLDRWFQESGARHMPAPVLEVYDTTQPITEDYEFPIMMAVG